jgi:DNA-binding MarR family transcriptional regulator
MEPERAMANRGAVEAEQEQEEWLDTLAYQFRVLRMRSLPPGWTERDCLILETLSRRRSATVAQLGAILGVRHTTTAENVKRLEKRGLLRKNRIGRITLLYATRKGRRAQDELAKAGRARIGLFLGALFKSKKERETFLRAVRRGVEFINAVRDL